MFCDGCGGNNRDDAKFCRACGRPLDPAPAEARSEAETVTDLEAATLATPVPASTVPEPIRKALAAEYEVSRLLGQGGMGAVYLARDLALDRPVAIKVLPADFMREERAVERFLQEARLAAKLRHPNIVSIHAMGKREEIYFFTMDFIDGDSLDAFVRRRSLTGAVDPGEAERILLEIASAVDHAHRQGIVHRDLKPGNVMLDENGHVFVLDFGLAKRQGEGGLTSSGIIVGTPQYMSPEQIQGKPATPKSDLYAVGLIWYFLLAGKPLVDGESVTAVVAQHLTTDFRPTIQADTRIPESARSRILALVEKDPEKRLASLDALIRGKSNGLGRGVDLEKSDPAAPGRGESAEATRPMTPTPPPVVPYRKQARERMKGLLDRLGKRENDQDE